METMLVTHIEKTRLFGAWTTIISRADLTLLATHTRMSRSSIEKSRPLNAHRSSDEEEAHLFEAPPPYELHATGDVLGSTAAVTREP
jgi:hypothetical protein